MCYNEKCNLISGLSKNNAHPITEHFKLRDGTAICKLCGRELVYRSKKYSANLASHMRSSHQEEYSLYSIMMKRQQEKRQMKTAGLFRMLNNMIPM